MRYEECGKALLSMHLRQVSQIYNKGVSSKQGTFWTLCIECMKGKQNTSLQHYNQQVLLEVI